MLDELAQAAKPAIYRERPVTFSPVQHIIPYFFHKAALLKHGG